MLNIHPSLLPQFKGLHTHRRALEAGVKRHGATVHFVVPEMDAGPIVVQDRSPVHEGDTEETLAARVLEVEHQIYPRALRAVALRADPAKPRNRFSDIEQCSDRSARASIDLIETIAVWSGLTFAKRRGSKYKTPG